MAHIDMYLKLDGITGGATDSAHSKECEIDAFHFGIQQMTTLGSASTGGGGGKSKAINMFFKKKLDVASPKLMQYCASGQVITTATFTGRKAGQKQQDFYTITLTNVLVASYSNSVGFEYGLNEKAVEWREETPAEAAAATAGFHFEYFELAYGSMKIDFKAQDNTGAVGGAVSGNYDWQTLQVK